MDGMLEGLTTRSTESQNDKLRIHPTQTTPWKDKPRLVEPGRNSAKRWARVRPLQAKIDWIDALEGRTAVRRIKRRSQSLEFSTAQGGRWAGKPFHGTKRNASGCRPRRNSHGDIAESDDRCGKPSFSRSACEGPEVSLSSGFLFPRQMSPGSPGKVALARNAKWEFRRRAVSPFRRGQLENRKPSQDPGFVSVPGFNAVTRPVTVATANQHDSSGPAARGIRAARRFRLNTETRKGSGGAFEVNGCGKARDLHYREAPQNGVRPAARINRDLRVKR